MYEGNSHTCIILVRSLIGVGIELRWKFRSNPMTKIRSPTMDILLSSQMSFFRGGSVWRVFDKANDPKKNTIMFVYWDKEKRKKETENEREVNTEISKLKGIDYLNHPLRVLRYLKFQVLYSPSMTIRMVGYLLSSVIDSLYFLTYREIANDVVWEKLREWLTKWVPESL